MTRKQARAILLRRVRHYIERQEERHLCYAIDRALTHEQEANEHEGVVAQVALSSAAYYLKQEVQMALDHHSTLESFIMRKMSVLMTQNEHNRLLLNEIRLDWVKQLKDDTRNVAAARRWLHERVEQDEAKFLVRQ